MNLSQLEQPVGHGRYARGGTSRALRHGGEVQAAVEAVAEPLLKLQRILGHGIASQWLPRRQDARPLGGSIRQPAEHCW